MLLFYIDLLEPLGVFKQHCDQTFQMTESGDVEVCINMKKALSLEDGPKELEGMVEKFLYMAVMVQEPTGERRTV